MIKQEYLERLHAERAAVLSAIEGLSDEEMTRPLGEGKWSIKDILGHLAAWEGEALKAFEQKARGERPSIADIIDYEAWNQVEANKRKDASLDEVRRELADGRSRLLAVVEALPDEGNLWTPERSTAKLLGMLIEHDNHHSKAIRERSGD